MSVTSIEANIESNDIVSPNDRFFFTLFIAIIFHGIIILGVTFGQNLKLKQTPPTLDVILLNHPETPAIEPKEADFIANSNQDGGGDTANNAHPRSPFTAFEQSQTRGIAPIPIKSSSKQEKQSFQQSIIQTLQNNPFLLNSQNRKQDKKVHTSEQTITFEHDLEMAQLSNEISEELDAHAKRPKKAFVNARTKNSPSAQYMYNWIKKVERIGNLNYPEQARNNNLSGNLVLMVAIKQDGSLYQLDIQRSSGSTILDQAAKKIVKMASPFSPFDALLKKSVDILYITRTWQFKSNRLSSQ